jgi:hypothetical protein
LTVALAPCGGDDGEMGADARTDSYPEPMASDAAKILNQQVLLT